MARRSLENRNIRKLQKSRGSYYITIPIDEVRELRWRERQKVVVKRIGRKIVIEDWKK